MSTFLPRSRSRPPTPACPPRLSFHRPQRPWRPPRLQHTTAGPLGPVTSGLSEAPAMCPLRGHRRRREGGSKHSASVGAAMSAGASPMSPRAEHTLGNRPSGPQRAGPGQERCGGGGPAGGSKTSGWGRGQRPDVPKWPRGGFGGWQRPAGELPAASTASPRLGPGPPGLRPLLHHGPDTRLPPGCPP